MKVRKSIIHGLSGFLVLCYAKTSSVTLRILSRGYLHGRNDEEFDIVAYYQGNLGYFDKEHLKFAIPAIFALLFMTCLPPILLLVYPLCYKVLALLKLEESKFTRLLCKAIPLEKFKPLFDSFQGEFKDDCRYFAGLYFIYRLLVLTLFTSLKQVIDFYFCIELLFLLITALHGIVSPYKKNWHNKFDLCILMLILIINGINTYIYTQTHHLLKEDTATYAWRLVQVLFAYSPLAFMIVYILKKLPVKNFMKYVVKIFKRTEEKDRSVLSLSILDEGREGVDYNKIN